MMDEEMSTYDCAVIGAGPAGLTAALYLARYHRTAIVFDGGPSRATWIPESHNCPGFPGGISGKELLRRLRAQLADYDAVVRESRVVELETEAHSFRLRASDGTRVVVRKVLIATGIVDVLPDETWIEEAITAGAMRLCTICDGYEVTDARIAVYGPRDSALDHALFLRTYSDDVSLVCSDDGPVSAVQAKRAREASVRILFGVRRLSFDGRRCTFIIADGKTETFDAVYPFLGCHTQSDLAVALGAECDEVGALLVGSDQMSSIEGVYVAGDVVSAVNQISVAVGHSGVAATAIHRALPPNFRRSAR